MSSTDYPSAPVSNTGKRFAAFVTRYGDDVALVSVYRRVGEGASFTIDFARPVSEYETLSAGAAESARREIRKLEQAAG